MSLHTSHGPDQPRSVARFVLNVLGAGREGDDVLVNFPDGQKWFPRNSLNHSEELRFDLPDAVNVFLKLSSQAKVRTTIPDDSRQQFLRTLHLSLGRLLKRQYLGRLPMPGWQQHPQSEKLWHSASQLHECQMV